MKSYIAFVCITLVCAAAGMADETSKEQNRATAPDNYSILKSGHGGAWFIPNALHEQYQQLKLRVERLNDAISRNDPDAGAAIQEITQLKAELGVLEQKIENEQVFVSPLKRFEQTDTYEFDPGSERMVILVSDKVRLESWDGPRIRCVMKKTILGKEQPSENEFAQILVEHEIKVAEEFVGQTPEQRSEANRKFLESPDGQALTEKQRAGRQQFVDDIARSYEKYAPFQGKAVNLLRVRGLLYDEGNRHLTVELDSSGGSGSMSGHWQRQAELTVFLPKTVYAAILGAQSGIHVTNFVGNLLLTNAHSQDRDYEGEFVIDGVEGDLAIHGAPIRTIRNIQGSVLLNNADEMRNGGTNHQDGLRKLYADVSLETSIQNVTGNLTAIWVHTKLRIAGIRGIINVVNQFGSTEVELSEALAEGAHRLLSESGSIRIRGPAAVFKSIPWTVVTQVGEIQTDVSSEVMEDVRFSTHGQSWVGFYSVLKEDDFTGRFLRFERPEQVNENLQRSSGFDVLSNAGRIVIETIR